MKIYLLRHGKTVWNAENRYQGRSDIPLSEEGSAVLTAADFSPAMLCVSPRIRALQTADRLFPGKPRQIIEAFAEMDFGAFEGRNAAEMESDPDYRAWTESGCRDRCPGGEDLAAFSERVCGAFAALVDQCAADGAFPLAIVSHGGIQMAVMERFGLPERSFFAWHAPHGGGCILEYEERLWQDRKKLRLLATARYSRELPC